MDGIFFFASAAASSAYLTVSETFPLEVRALAIAFFYAIGTGIGRGGTLAVRRPYRHRLALERVRRIHPWLGTHDRALFCVAAERKPLEAVKRNRARAIVAECARVLPQAFCHRRPSAFTFFVWSEPAVAD
jgi:hypothetical protein